MTKIDSAENPKECFDGLSMNGFLVNVFDSDSVRSFDELRTGSEPVEGLRRVF